MKIVANTDAEKEFLKIFASFDAERINKSRTWLQKPNNLNVEKLEEVYVTCTDREKALIQMLHQIDNEAFLTQVFLETINKEIDVFTDFQATLFETIKSSEQIKTIIESLCDDNNKGFIEFYDNRIKFLNKIVEVCKSDEEITEFINNLKTKKIALDRAARLKLMTGYSDELKMEYYKLLYEHEKSEEPTSPNLFSFESHFPLTEDFTGLIHSPYDILFLLNDKELAKQTALKDYTKSEIYHKFIKFQSYGADGVNRSKKANVFGFNDEEIYECFLSAYNEYINFCIKEADKQIEELKKSMSGLKTTKNYFEQQKEKYIKSNLKKSRNILFHDTGSVNVNKNIIAYIVSRGQIIDTSVPNTEFIDFLVNILQEIKHQRSEEEKLTEKDEHTEEEKLTEKDERTEEEKFIEELIYDGVKNYSPSDIDDKCLQPAFFENTYYDDPHFRKIILPKDLATKFSQRIIKEQTSLPEEKRSEAFKKYWKDYQTYCEIIKANQGGTQDDNLQIPPIDLDSVNFHGKMGR